MGLGRTATRGALLASGANVGTYALSFASSIVLARLLTPTEFGEAALASTIADFLFLIISVSLPTALVREPAASVQIALRTSVAMVAMASGGLVVIGGSLAVALSLWVEGPVGVLFAAFLAARIPSLFALLLTSELQRNNAYGRYSMIIYGSQAISLVVVVTFGFLGAGVWALVSRDVTVGLTMLIMAIAFSRWNLRLGFNRAKARELLKFGVQMMGSRIGDVLFHRYDNLVVGAATNSTQLGLYNQAYVIAELGNKAYAPVIFQVPLTVYAQLQGDAQRTQRMYELTMFVILRSVVPIGLVLLLFPTELMGLMFGSPWKPAGDMLRALGAYAVLLPIFEHARVLLIANGNVAATLRARAVQLAVFLPATIPLTIWLGAEGAGISVAVAMIVGTFAIVRSAQSLARFRAADCRAPVIGGLVAAVVASIGAHQINGDTLRLLLGSVSAVVLYGALLVVLERQALISNVKLFASFLRPTSRSSGSSAIQELAAEPPRPT
jgi:O-antigen/teichoic acid export membrane protein